MDRHAFESDRRTAMCGSADLQPPHFVNGAITCLRCLSILGERIKADKIRALEAELATARAERHHNAIDCANAVVKAAREQSAGQTDEQIVAATIAGSAIITDELMRVGRERDAAREALATARRDALEAAIEIVKRMRDVQFNYAAEAETSNDDDAFEAHEHTAEILREVCNQIRALAQPATDDGEET